MSDFAGMEELLRDFLLESSDMLSDVDSKLVVLEKNPADSELLDELVRGFHTIKGGAGFLNATELVSLCRLIENLFDKLRKHELILSAELLGVAYAGIAEVRRMFGELQHGQQPCVAANWLLEELNAALSDQVSVFPATKQLDDVVSNSVTLAPRAVSLDNVDWVTMYKVLAGENIVTKQIARRDREKIVVADLEKQSTSAISGRRDGDVPATEAGEFAIQADAVRLDQVLYLSGEICLTRSRLEHLRAGITQGRNDANTVHEVDLAIRQLDMLAVNLHYAVMQTGRQPIV